MRVRIPVSPSWWSTNGVPAESGTCSVTSPAACSLSVANRPSTAGSVKNVGERVGFFVAESDAVNGTVWIFGIVDDEVALA